MCVVETEMSLDELVRERCLYKTDDGVYIATPDEWQTNLTIDLWTEPFPRPDRQMRV